MRFRAMSWLIRCHLPWREVSLWHLGFAAHQIKAEHLPGNQRFQTREQTLEDVTSSGLNPPLTLADHRPISVNYLSMHPIILSHLNVNKCVHIYITYTLIYTYIIYIIYIKYKLKYLVPNKSIQKNF